MKEEEKGYIIILVDRKIFINYYKQNIQDSQSS